MEVSQEAEPFSLFDGFFVFAGFCLGALTLLAGLVLLLIEPHYGALVLGMLGGAVAAVSIFGVAGSLAVLPVACSFFLMVRFDEGLALPLDEVIQIKHSYWFPLMALFLLFLWSRWQRDSSKPTLDAPRLSVPLVCFGLFGLLTILVNHLLDTHVPARELLGEFLALGIIVTPVLFALVLPTTMLSPFRTLLCLRCIVFFGGVAGLIMSMFGLLPSSVLGLLGWTGGTGGTVDLIRGRLPLGHPNTVAAVMLLLMPSAVILGLGDRRALWRAMYLGCAGFMFCGTLFSLSRGALLCMTLTVGASLLYLWSTWQGVRRLLGTFFIAVFGLALVGVALYLFTQRDFSRFWSRGFYEEASVERRMDSMTTALFVWKDHPLHGAGPDAVYPRLELRPGWIPPLADVISPIFFYEGHTTAETPHNFYLTVFAEFGLIGAAFFFWLLWRLFRRLWRARRLPELTLPERRLFTAVLLGLCAFLMIGMFEAVLMTSVRANLVFWIFAGLALRYARIKETGLTNPTSLTSPTKD